ncbi:hypothetical protein [Shewanella sp. GutCb]|jgi:hypothetical protein|nr:hypothetical protein [Shewanella sp. GutCb]
MNALIDYEAGKLVELFDQDDDLSIYIPIPLKDARFRGIVPVQF